MNPVGVDVLDNLDARIQEHPRISPSSFTKKKVNAKGNTASDNLLLCNHSRFCECFSVRTKANQKFVLELRESILVMEVKPLNKNIRSASLYLFGRV